LFTLLALSVLINSISALYGTPLHPEALKKVFSIFSREGLELPLSTGMLFIVDLKVLAKTPTLSGELCCKEAGGWLVDANR
jgi:hypothetical protein